MIRRRPALARIVRPRVVLPLAVLLAAMALGGCVFVPDHGGYHDGYAHGDHGDHGGNHDQRGGDNDGH